MRVCEGSRALYALSGSDGWSRSRAVLLTGLGREAWAPPGHATGPGRRPRTQGEVKVSVRGSSVRMMRSSVFRETLGE